MEVRISKDIRTYKAKDIGNFSFKEIGYIVGGVGSAFVTYALTGSELCILPMVLVIVFGFAKPNGLTMPTFIRTVVKDKVLPQTYIWETDFVYNPDEFEDLYGKDIHFVAEAEDVIQTDMPVKYTKNDRIYL